LSFQYGTEQVSYCYRNANVALDNIHMPFSPKALTKKGYYYWGVDFSRAILGSTYLDPVQGGPVVIDGNDKPGLDLYTDHSWWAVLGPAGALMNVVELDQNQRQVVSRGCLLKEHPAKTSNQENDPGSPQVGFILHNIEKLSKGNYSGVSYLFFPYPASRAKLEEFLNLVEHPLKVEASADTNP